jgi:hypothetical protein
LPRDPSRNGDHQLPCWPGRAEVRLPVADVLHAVSQRHLDVLETSGWCPSGTRARTTVAGKRSPLEGFAPCCQVPQVTQIKSCAVTPNNTAQGWSGAIERKRDQVPSLFPVQELQKPPVPSVLCRLSDMNEYAELYKEQISGNRGTVGTALG